ncbi:PREDICTED: ribosomal biogenesis protein LAS1L-like [Ipomoea nil]|uniref:ribosomal biogenesis protein LAS1L-like n=1 Tax=Ipomoea nil TaxID=35883 RepID=UPI000900B4BC|nr:PREDICTED: ribosomal biogenesis protein LAS1L-like [Ipomoea nil]
MTRNATRFVYGFLLSQTQLYVEDWIGLKTLDDAGRVKFVNVSGNHLGISKSDMKKFVVPYLEDESSENVAAVKRCSSGNCKRQKEAVKINYGNGFKKNEEEEEAAKGEQLEEKKHENEEKGEEQQAADEKLNNEEKEEQPTDDDEILMK